MRVGIFDRFDLFLGISVFLKQKQLIQAQAETPTIIIDRDMV